MKSLRKPSVALIIMLVAILLATGIGLLKSRMMAPPSPVPDAATPYPSSSGSYDLDNLDTRGYDKWIDDGAKELSKKTEEMICLYNANWDSRYNSVIAVATVKGVSGDLAGYAYDCGSSMGLGENDAILVLDVKNMDAYLATGDEFATMLSDDMATDYMDTHLYDLFMEEDFDEGVLNLFAALHELYVDTFGR